MKIVFSMLFLFGTSIASFSCAADESSEEAIQAREEQQAMIQKYEARIRQLERYSVKIVSGMKTNNGSLVTANSVKERSADGVKVSLFKAKKKS